MPKLEREAGMLFLSVENIDMDKEGWNGQLFPFLRRNCVLLFTHHPTAPHLDGEDAMDV